MSLNIGLTRNLMSDLKQTDPRLSNALENLLNEIVDLRKQVETLEDILAGKITTGDIIPWASVDKTGSSLADLATRSATNVDSGTLPTAQLPNIPDAKITGNYTQAVTISNAGNTLRGAMKSADDTAGETASFNATVAPNLVFKNGLLVGHS